MDFNPQGVADQAGIWIFNGVETLFAKLYSTVDTVGNKVVAFSYETERRSVNSPVQGSGSVLWLKLVRTEHILTGYCSADAINWIQVGDTLNVSGMDGLQPNYNSWTGNRQGLFVQGSPANFDLYIYRDAYTPIAAECPANQDGTNASAGMNGQVLSETHDGDWALYAGVEFGNTEYPKQPDSLFITASCASTGGSAEVWIDSLDSGTKIAQCKIGNTGSWSTFATVGIKLLTAVSGNHDVYMRFNGSSPDSLLLLRSFVFSGIAGPAASVHNVVSGQLPHQFELEQNFPNPFNPTTQIEYSVPRISHISLSVYNILGQRVVTLFDGVRQPGAYTAVLDGSRLASGVYFYRLQSDAFVDIKKLVLLKSGNKLLLVRLTSRRSWQRSPIHYVIPDPSIQR